MTGLRPLIAEKKITVAPFVFDGLSALMATEAGFEALYLSGGSLGYMKAVTEANLTVTEMAAVGVDIASVCKTPLILDGAAGWGDPMHLRRTIALAERAGFGAIEIEDQVLPKRAHHHIGVEHLIPAELMAAKIGEAVAARTSLDFVIIGRSNAARHNMDEALRRAEAYRKAGADMILSFPTSPEQMRNPRRAVGSAPGLHDRARHGDRRSRRFVRGNGVSRLPPHHRRRQSADRAPRSIVP